MIEKIVTMFRIATVLSLLASPLVAESPYALDVVPHWSPDGSQIVFMSERSGSAQVWVMNADGSNIRRLTDRDGYDGDPSWSPDGEKIAFCSDRDGNEEIYVMNADGSDPTNLSRHPARDCDTPSWSPDGRRLVFVSTRAGDWKTKPEDNYEIYVMDADGSNQTRLTNTPGYDLTTGQAWSPDGKHIVFCSSYDSVFVPDTDDEYDEFDLFVMDADGSNVRRLTDMPGQDSYPYWSPDGTTISFTRDHRDDPARYDVYTIKVDGSGMQRITDLPGNEFTAAFSPDGKRIVYASTEDRPTLSLFVANADGTDRVRLTNR